MRCSSATIRPARRPGAIVTALDGTADVRLRPGNYTVESDRPVAFQGKAYQWTQIVDIVAGRDAVLELTADNAEVEAAAAATASAAPLEADPSFLLPQWQDSVVALWTPTTHASGFVVDAKGLIATNQRVIGAATSVEVQLTPAVKVAARVLAADPARDVAILWIDPKVAAAVRPVPLGCAQAAKPPRRRRAGALHDRRSAPWAEGHDVRDRQPRGAARHRVRLQARVRAARAARSSPPAAAWSGSPRSRTSKTRRQARRRPSRPHRRCVRRRRVGGEEDEGCGAAGRHASSRGAGAAVSRGRAQGRGRTPRRQPEPVPDVLVRLRRRLHHARADLRRAVPVGAGERTRA